MHDMRNDPGSRKRHALGSILDARRRVIPDTAWFGVAFLAISIGIVIDAQSWKGAAVALIPFGASVVLLLRSRRRPR